MINYEQRTSGRIGSRRFRQHGPQLAHAHTPPSPSPHPLHPCFATLPADRLYTAIERTVRRGCGFKYIFSAKPKRRGRGWSFVCLFISFIHSLSQRRGSASIPCSLWIAAEDRQKNRSGGGRGPRQWSCRSGAAANEDFHPDIYISFIPPKKRFRIEKRINTKKRALPSHIS